MSRNRISVGFSPEAMAWLECTALGNSMTVSELLRRLVDEVRGATLIKREWQGVFKPFPAANLKPE